MSVAAAAIRPALLARVFRFRNDRECLNLLLIVLPFVSLLYNSLFVPGVTQYSDRRLAFHISVINGTAPSPGQYQCYVHDLIMESVFRFLPHKSGWFNVVWVGYYAFGATVFLLLLLRLCRRMASVKASVLACLYLVAVYPIFLYDNWYHPADPYGLLLATLIMECLLNKGRTWRYYLLLFLSGFAWEKHLMIPASVGLADLARRRPVISAGFAGGISMLVASVGQIIPRVVYGLQRSSEFRPLGANLPQLPFYLFGVTLLFGAQVYFAIRKWRTVPVVLRTLLLQLPAFFILYMTLGANVMEMRAIFIVVPLTWPLLAMFFDCYLLSSSVETSPAEHEPRK